MPSYCVMLCCCLPGAAGSSRWHVVRMMPSCIVTIHVRLHVLSAACCPPLRGWFLPPHHCQAAALSTLAVQ
jgi:hypothetical protein